MPRAIWKGRLKLGELACGVALHAATSTAERIAFHTINRATGHKVQRRYVDAGTGAAVERDDQVKGYEVSDGDYVMLEPDDVAAAVPQSDKTLAVTAFIPCAEVDEVYLDKPYYLAPAQDGDAEAFVLIREALARLKVAALAEAVLFRRVRRLLIRPLEAGLITETLNFDYEVRPADEAFAGVPELKIDAEMLALAKHIIAGKAGRFDPAAVEDRYEAALADLVRAKLEGRPIPRPKAVKAPARKDLLAALRDSAALGDGPAKRPRARTPKGTEAGPAKSRPAPRRKAG